MKLDFIICILTLLFGIATQAIVVAAENPTPQDYVAVYNDGGGDFGPWYVTKEKPWGKVYEEAEKYKFLMLHNPGGHDGFPMELDQLLIMDRRAKAEPNNLNYKARADWPALIAASQKRTKWEAWYVGGAKYFKKREGESDKAWCQRAMLALRPMFLARPDYVFWDAEKDPSPHMLLLMKECTKRGIKNGIEPCTYADEKAKPYRKLAVVLQTEFLEARLTGRNGWATGKNAVRPLRDVRLHPLVLEALPGKNVLAEVEAARKRGNVPAINFLKIPKGWK
jgi:hypothetical protein